MDREKEIENLEQIFRIANKNANVEPVFEDENGVEHYIPQEAVKVIEDILDTLFIPFLAEVVVDAGYRKLADDDIVLTKAMQDGSCEGMDDRTLAFFAGHNATVRKDTIKRVCQALYDFCTREDNPWQEIEISKDEVLEWAKQNDINIEV